MSKSDLDRVFKAISDPRRRDVFHVLVVASAAMSITQISTHFDISRQGVSKHINVLEDAGLVVTTSKGRERFCKALPRALRGVKDWTQYYEEYWDDKLDRLGRHLA